MGDANRADPNCLACKGLGMIWIPSGTIIGMVTNISQQKDLIDAGIASPGDLVLSPSDRYTVSDYDKIQIHWHEGVPYEGQLIRRSYEDFDTANYIITDIIDCLSVDPSTGESTIYKVDEDFTFSGTKITWISDNKPAENDFYSIKYSATVDWICFAPPQPRRERGTNLGQKVIMKKKHLVTF